MKPDVMVLGWKTMGCLGWELLPHAKEFKYLRVLEDGAGDKQTVVGGICGNCRCCKVRRAFSRKAKLWIYVPILTDGHELWALTKRTWLWMLWRSSYIWRKLGVEQLSKGAD